jgi:hypothetical protein
MKSGGGQTALPEKTWAAPCLRFAELLAAQEDSTHGEAFAIQLTSTHSRFNLLLYPAREKQVVLLPGEGSAAPLWTVRISLANLRNVNSTGVGRKIRETSDLYTSISDTNIWGANTPAIE